jgi:radical SAM protein with 4Fe4S-binding SPASM domain
VHDSVNDASFQLTPDSVTSEAFGDFLCAVFDEWAFHDLGKTEVQIFAETALVKSGGQARLCWMAPTCGRVLVVEQDGGVYSCDHFVDDRHRIGEINVLTPDAQKKTETVRTKPATQNYTETVSIKLDAQKQTDIVSTSPDAQQQAEIVRTEPPTQNHTDIVSIKQDAQKQTDFVSTKPDAPQQTATLAALVNSPAQVAFGRDKRDSLTDHCLNCPWLKYCNGGCPKDRVAEVNVLCEGYRRFFSHADGVLDRIIELRKSGAAPSAVMSALILEARAKWKGVGRNDPCPCGSGKKFKVCCMRKEL